MENIFVEIFEEYRDMIKKYCLAEAHVEIRKDENGYFFDCTLKDSVYILAGLFPEEMVIPAFEDFDFKDIDKEGCWQLNALLSYSHAQYGDEGRVEVQDYLMIEHVECVFQCTIEEKEKQLQDMKELDLFGNSLNPSTP
jgi:hypothetical protein